MSIYATINEGEPEFFSSSAGWTNVDSWAEKLDESKYPNLIHLVEHGYTEKIESMIDEMDAAIKELTPDESVQKTLVELSAICIGETGIVLISNGIVNE